MRKFLTPRFLLVVISTLVVVYCVFASTPIISEDCATGLRCTESMPTKATELLWESFSQQFVSAVSNY